MLVQGLEAVHALADGVLESFNKVDHESVVAVNTIATKGLRPKQLAVRDGNFAQWLRKRHDISISIGHHIIFCMCFQKNTHYLTVRCKVSIGLAFMPRLCT